MYEKLVTGLLALSLFLAACGQDSDQQKTVIKKKMIKRKLNNKIKTNDSSKDKKDNKDNSKDVNKDNKDNSANDNQQQSNSNATNNDQNQTNNNQSNSGQTTNNQNQVTLHHIMDKTQRQWLVKFIHLMVINHKHYNNCLISKQL